MYRHILIPTDGSELAERAHEAAEIVPSEPLVWSVLVLVVGVLMAINWWAAHQKNGPVGGRSTRGRRRNCLSLWRDWAA
jgi:nucleotide-binding universal stress UspA family protein